VFEVEEQGCTIGARPGLGFCPILGQIADSAWPLGIFQLNHAGPPG
jgi:hypothetical protein